MATIEEEDDEPRNINGVIQHIGGGDDDHLCRETPGPPANDDATP
jgi:hypothetical protein